MGELERICIGEPWLQSCRPLPGSISSQNPFIHRSLLVKKQVRSPAHFPSRSHPALTFLLHSFIFHPCTIPGLPSTSLLQPSSTPLAITFAVSLSLAPHPHSTKRLVSTSPFPISFPRSAAFSRFPSFSMYHPSIFVFTPSHCAYTFLQLPSCHHRLLVFWWNPLWDPSSL